MRLSHKGIYALRAVFDVAFHGGGEPVQLKEIAERELIPLRYLEQIFQDLKKADLIRSKRGPKGGYSLIGKPSDVSVADVLAAVGELPALPDVSETEGDQLLVTDTFFESLVGELRSLLAGASLEDMMQRADELGVSRESYESFVYVI